VSEESKKPLPKGSLTWFEIPTGDIQRAAAFFREVLAAPLIDISAGEPMHMFPMFDGEVGGAIVQREDAKPGATGTVVYLRVGGALTDAMDRVEPAGGKVLTPAMTVPNVGGTFCVIQDSEGNHVGLHAER
jgi:uncharacterized protein